jgi:hypothetical protein
MFLSFFRQSAISVWKLFPFTLLKVDVMMEKISETVTNSIVTWQQTVMVCLKHRYRFISAGEFEAF